MVMSKEEHLSLLDGLLGGVQDHSRKQKKLTKASDRIKADMLRETLFKQQLDLFNETEKMVSILCPRRAGKSVAMLIRQVYDCISVKGFMAAICCVSRPTAEKIYWRDLIAMDSKYNLGIHFNNTKLIAEFPNGSILVFLSGADKGEVAKIRGQRFNRVCIDECGEYPPHVLEDMIFETVMPALLDMQGAIWLAGTPPEVATGTFYEATCTPPLIKEAEIGTDIHTNWKHGTERPSEFTWKFHTWTSKDNTAMPHLWQSALDVKRKMGWKDDNPVWRREYLGEHVLSSNVLVYTVRPERHIYRGPWPWEDSRVNRCRFVSGLDIGYKDGTALVIWCYVEDEPYIYEFISMKQVELVPEQIAAMVKDAEKLLPKAVNFRVADAGNNGLMVVESLNRTYNLAFEVADKNEKMHYIKLFNMSLDSNAIRFRPGSPLLEEMVENRWDEKTIGTSRQKESVATPNDLCDAALYSYRAAIMRFVTDTPMPVLEKSDSQRLKDEYVAKRSLSVTPWFARKEIK